LYRSLYRSDVRRVLRATGQSSGHARRLLDIGCGPGLRLQAFRERGFDVVGMDFQPSVIESLQRELGIAGVCCDVTSLEHRFPPASFDLITAYYVLEHVLDVRGLLEAAKQLLRPGGWLVAAVPLADSLQASVLGARWTQVREAPRHVSLPSRRSLGRLVERVGFGDVRWLPDSLRLCAANVGLTLVPASTSHHAFGRTRWRSLAARAGAIAAASAAAPACWLENYCWRRPSMGLALARKPQSGRTER
jgi:SAM-dependent methyltransferase